VLRALIYALMIAPGVVVMFIHSVIFFAGRRFKARFNPASHAEESKPGVSIIVPVKDEPEHIIIELVENLGNNLKEAGVEYEVLVVSDDSPDAIAGVKSKAEETAMRVGLKDFRFVVRTEGPKGRAGALNYGVLKSRHDLVLILDADSRIRESTIPELVSCVESGHDVCVGKWVGYTYRKTKLGVSITHSMKYVVDALYRGRFNVGLMVFPLGTGTLYRREALVKVGLWEPDVIQDDMYMGTKLHGANCSVGFAEKAVIEVSVPSGFKAFTLQQSRWAYGAIETLRKGYVKHVLRKARRSSLLVVEGLIFLLQYLPLAGLAFSLLLVPVLSAFLHEDLMNLSPYILTLFVSMTFIYGTSLYKSIKELGLPRVRVLRSMGSIAAFSTSISPYILLHSLKALANNHITYVVTPKGSKERSLKGVRGVNGITLFTTYLITVTVVNLFLNNYYTALWTLVFAAANIYVILNAERPAPLH
ncbi:MAG: glycosyltransferase family 2 protein, partial [Zestosphaera sp.]